MISFDYSFNIKDNRWEFLVKFKTSTGEKYIANYINISENNEYYLSVEEILKGFHKVFKTLNEELEKTSVGEGSENGV